MILADRNVATEPFMSNASFVGKLRSLSPGSKVGLVRGRGGGSGCARPVQATYSTRFCPRYKHANIYSMKPTFRGSSKSPLARGLEQERVALPCEHTARERTSWDRKESRRVHVVWHRIWVSCRVLLAALLPATALHKREKTSQAQAQRRWLQCLSGAILQVFPWYLV